VYEEPLGDAVSAYVGNQRSHSVMEVNLYNMEVTHVYEYSESTSVAFLLRDGNGNDSDTMECTSMYGYYECFDETCPPPHSIQCQLVSRSVKIFRRCH